MSTIALRRLHHGERRPVLDVFEGMSDRSRRLRFHGPKPRLREEELERLVDVGCCGREAVAAVESATGRSVGIARFVRDTDDPSSVEVAFSVVDEWQHRGVGRRLLRELRRSALRQGVVRFHATVVTGNEAAFALLRGAGRIVSVDAEDGAFEIVVELARGRSDWSVPARDAGGTLRWIVPAA